MPLEVRINGWDQWVNNLLVHGIYEGYNPITILLLTSWDIQVRSSPTQTEIHNKLRVEAPPSMILNAGHEVSSPWLLNLFKRVANTPPYHSIPTKISASFFISANLEITYKLRYGFWFSRKQWTKQRLKPPNTVTTIIKSEVLSFRHSGNNQGSWFVTFRKIQVHDNFKNHNAINQTILSTYHLKLPNPQRLTATNRFYQTVQLVTSSFSYSSIMWGNVQPLFWHPLSTQKLTFEHAKIDMRKQTPLRTTCWTCCYTATWGKHGKLPEQYWTLLNFVLFVKPHIFQQKKGGEFIITQLLIH